MGFDIQKSDGRVVVVVVVLLLGLKGRLVCVTGVYSAWSGGQPPMVGY